MSYISVSQDDKGKFQIRYNGMSHGSPLTSAILANQIALKLQTDTYPKATISLAPETIEKK